MQVYIDIGRAGCIRSEWAAHRLEIGDVIYEKLSNCPGKRQLI